MSEPAKQLFKVVLPPLFNSVDEVAINSQSTLLRLRALELCLLVVGAVSAEFSVAAEWGIGPIVSLLAFVGALAIRVSGADRIAERRWYEARAAAESIKSMSWQYATGGEGFRSDDATAEARFVAEMSSILNELPDLNVPPRIDSPDAIPSELRELRVKPTLDRQTTYVEQRVTDQLSWYARKAKWNRRRATWWQAGLATVELCAICLGLGRIQGWYEADLLGIVAAIAASLAAWQQTKNFLTLSTSYAVTAQDVLLVKAKFSDELGETALAQAIHDAEAAFSREHTMWRARKQGPIRSS